MGRDTGRFAEFKATVLEWYSLDQNTTLKFRFDPQSRRPVNTQYLCAPLRTRTV